MGKGSRYGIAASLLAAGALTAGYLFSERNIYRGEYDGLGVTVRVYKDRTTVELLYKKQGVRVLGEDRGSDGEFEKIVTFDEKLGKEDSVNVSDVLSTDFGEYQARVRERGMLKVMEQGIALRMAIDKLTEAKKAVMGENKKKD